MSGTPKRKRALVVLNCGLSVASATVRALQYRPHFDRSPDWSAEFVSRKSERWSYWVNRTQQPGVPGVVPLVHRPLARGAAAWERRQEDAIVRRAAQCDLVYLVKMPHLRLYRRLRELGGPQVVMDLNDGLWLPAFQAHEWQDLDAILATVHGVICENEHVADYARRHSSRVTVVPDSPQLAVFDRWRDEVRRRTDQVVIGWIGGVENVGALYRVVEPLEALFARHPQLHLRVVGASQSSLPRFESVRWSCLPAYNQEQMVREALAFDIGLFPMFHNGDGRARGTLKAMIYMSAGAAVLAENYGENPSLIQDGVNGVLAASPDEWLQKLEWLVVHPQERAALGQRGMQTIREQFTAEKVFRQLTAAFDTLVAPESARVPAAPRVAMSSGRNAVPKVKPTFLVLGAMKCATTSLTEIFARHPQMFVSTPKEPEFFSNDEIFARGGDWYASLFAGGAGRLAVGEGSTGYTKQMRHPLAAERVARHLPEAKLIYIVRHPLQRMESHWLHLAACGERMPPLAGALQKWPHIVDTSLYWKQINAYRSRYGDERILVLFFEDFVRQPEVEIARCYQFLGVDPKAAGADPATPHHVSGEKRTDGRALRWLRRSPAALSIGRLVPKLARAVQPFLQRRLPARPEWPADLRREVGHQIRDDAGEFLRFYGKPADFWRLE